MKRGSEDIRTLAVQSVLSKKFSVRLIAEQTGYSLATIYNWMRVYEKEKRLAPKPAGHRQPVFSESEHEKAKELDLFGNPQIVRYRCREIGSRTGKTRVTEQVYFIGSRRLCVGPDLV